MSTQEVGHKAAAVRQWTADPCGASVAEGDPGSPSYFQSLLAARNAYAPWMSEVLNYSDAAGLRVLDVGCGQGIDVAQYALAGARAFGVDLTPRHVDLARQHVRGLGVDADIQEGDAEGLPYESESFDRVSSNGVLHHTPDMPAALREIRRVLRPGGDGLVIVYNKLSLHYLVHEVLGRGVLKGQLLTERSMEAILSRDIEYSSIDARPLVRVYSPSEMRRLMVTAGFECVGIAVRHFRPEDTFITLRLARRLAALRDPKVLDRIGRIAGWYVIATGTAPVTATSSRLA